MFNQPVEASAASLGIVLAGDSKKQSADPEYKYEEALDVALRLCQLEDKQAIKLPPFSKQKGLDKASGNVTTLHLADNSPSSLVIDENAMSRSASEMGLKLSTLPDQLTANQSNETPTGASSFAHQQNSNLFFLDKASTSRMNSLMFNYGVSNTALPLLSVSIGSSEYDKDLDYSDRAFSTSRSIKPFQGLQQSSPPQNMRGPISDIISGRDLPHPTHSLSLPSNIGYFQNPVDVAQQSRLAKPLGILPSLPSSLSLPVSQMVGSVGSDAYQILPSLGSTGSRVPLDFPLPASNGSSAATDQPSAKLDGSPQLATLEQRYGQLDSDHLVVPSPMIAGSSVDNRAKLAEPNRSQRSVNLTGAIVVDGRRLGLITASSQARQASLPARGPSRVNLRAVPIYSGMQIPS